MRSFLYGPTREGGAKSYAHAAELHVSKGEYLFKTRCAACHTIGRGDEVGPDLGNVVGARDRAWLTRFIQFPDRVLAARDPIAEGLYEKYNRVNMPNLSLGPEDVEAIIGYLDAQAKARAAESSSLHPSAGGEAGTERKVASTR